MERKNINRGYKQLRVWNDSIDLYVISCHVLLNFPFELKKTAGNCIDSVHSISRNIAEGYCRRGIKEYLNFLNIALASSGEFHSSLVSFLKANQISKENFEKLDELHYKTENALISLIKSLQIKLKDGSLETNFDK
jgi:four helix bundle protein